MAHKKRRRHRKSRGRPFTPPEPGTSGGAPQARIEAAPEKSAGRRRGLPLWIGGAAVIIAVLTLAVFLARPRGGAGVNRDSQLNVLLITLDTTRADHLGCYGYSKGKTPNLDALARDGVRFENVYAQVPLTLPSHCSIMTGTYPIIHNVHNNGTYVLTPEHTTLAKVLKNKGFRTAAIVASFSVDSRFGLDQGFDVYDDDFQPGLPFKPANSERKAGEVAARFSDWLDKNASGQFFVWLHFFDPHLPYDPPSPYKEEFAANPYDGEIAYMDAAVGTVVDKLREKGLLDRTLVVLAGDHGEAFGEKVETGHGVFLYDETLKVPLILYAPGHLAGGKTIASRARLIDIVPTVLDMMNVPAPPAIQGVSLLRAVGRGKGRDLDSYLETFYPRENYGWSELTGFVSGEWKYIKAPRAELYNLRSDPAEKQNKIAAVPDVAAAMRRKLEAVVRESAGISRAANRTLTAEEQERLRSLGYINFAGVGAQASHADPKDKLDVLRLSQRAEGYELQGKFAEAEEAYAKLLPLVPESPASYVNLALAHARQKKFDEAIATLRQGVEMIPGSEVLLSRLGYTYLVSGQFDEALTTMAKVLKINPKNVDALTVLAGVLDTLRRKDEARVYYEKAIGIEPENQYLRMSYAANLASSGLLDRAIKVYESLVRDYPYVQALRQYLGIAYGIAGQYAKSIESLKEAVYLKPTPTAYYNLAIACRKSGDIGEAVRYLKLYLDDPSGEPEQIIRSAQAELKRLEASLSK